MYVHLVYGVGILIGMVVMQGNEFDRCCPRSPDEL